MKTYIGDGVYAEYDGFGVWLTTQRGDVEHHIHLEPDMFAQIGRLTGWTTKPTTP